ncbi:hypothetical protein [Rhodohalobacter mucosus]|uniref:Uncharacterized protein n=1 Tax=Rhodohalobacter mucosus TaxID=2079485 RepID=A0A316TPH8_9BACT|nr:hypothetical protein [Rhodohalobacter mucosus]PWN06310.1 hypothetical protein DDZ15_10840 [Rhodohalobacter mucosus]
MKIIAKSLAVALILILTTLNLNFVYQLNPFDLQFGVEISDIQASSTLEHDHIMEEEICWVTGEEIDICRYSPNMICDVPAQDTCSDSNPGEN